MANNETTKNKTSNEDEQTIKSVDKKASKSEDSVEKAKDKAVNIIDEQKSKVTSGLDNVADSIRNVGENLRKSEGDNSIARATAHYGENLADKIESFSGYVENATIKDLTRDVEGFARRQPALFIGGAFLVGLLATRFLKTSAPNSSYQTRDNDRENYDARESYSSAKTA